MAGSNQYGFSKRERERKNQKKKEEKLARRHGKKREETGPEDRPDGEEE